MARLYGERVYIVPGPRRRWQQRSVYGLLVQGSQVRLWWVPDGLSLMKRWRSATLGNYTGSCVRLPMSYTRSHALQGGRRKPLVKLPVNCQSWQRLRLLFHHQQFASHTFMYLFSVVSSLAPDARWKHGHYNNNGVEQQTPIHRICYTQGVPWLFTIPSSHLISRTTLACKTRFDTVMYLR